MKKTINNLDFFPEYELERLSYKLNNKNKLGFDQIKIKLNKNKLNRYFKKILPGHLLAFLAIVTFIKITRFLVFNSIDIIFIFIAIILTSFTFLNNKKKFQIIWINYLLNKNFIELNEIESCKDPNYVINKAREFLNTINIKQS